MLICEITDPAKQLKTARQERYRGRKIATHLVGKTGRPIPDDVKTLADKHIRPRTNQTVKPQYSHYIVQYDDPWYQRTFGMSGWDEFWSKFKPYYVIG
jgi:hypothetical protein